MLAIRLPDSIEKRLAKLAKRTGRSKAFYAWEAILNFSAWGATNASLATG
jgi:RHH-type rel operon transcriptional repressor/antitoxin RelB